MNVSVIGGGAIGLLYAARLAMSGNRVQVWTRTEDQALALQAKGIVLLERHVSAVVHVEARTALTAESLGAKTMDSDLILLTVKQPHINEDLMMLLQHIAKPGTMVLCLQNGIGHMDKLRSRLPQLSFAAAVTTEGALREDSCTVNHTGHGELWIEKMGETHIPSGMAENLAIKQKMFVQHLESAGIKAFLSNEMNNRIYQKLLINSVINPLTALYGVKNGELPSDPLRRSLMFAVYKESSLILAAAGLAGDTDHWERVLAVCASTADNESSMLRDVRAGRRTEIDWINGGISALASEHEMAAPLNDSVTALINALST
ncbi:ketopantoate reductase family protein [Paenibacillus abyssi]|uniref:2-dehydropantoate 2-reductase n=1 Tax=Paenibacillus abyssi TaxID=1340531 RepID=A0A917D469_9BACL|nr:2-dehydropantoate 2-reductase [Paenibacillus abyssi]GGG10349.1 putative 2-dehydropantoate 2-reductase [Paenibacillus abyssi]